MELTLLSSANLTFKSSCKNKDGTMSSKQATVCVETLVNPDSELEVMPGLNFLTKLEGLLFAQASREGKRQRLSDPVDSRLKVRVCYGPISPAAPDRKNTAFFNIYDASESDGLFKRLVSICGGRENITAHLDLELRTKDNDWMKLNFQGLTTKMKRDKQGTLFCKSFNLNQNLTSAWVSKKSFIGIISLKLTLNDDALNWIHLNGLGAGEMVNRKLLEDAPQSGDTVIVVENGVNVKCHKVFLIGHSEVFRAMLTSDMKEANSSVVNMPDISEGGVKALLAYMYCSDIKEPLTSSQTAMELLRVADKYDIVKLFEIMTQMILGKRNDRFSSEAAVQLLLLAKKRNETPDFKQMEEKAKAVLRSKSPDELKQCADFCEQFCNPESGMEMCFCLMQNL